MADTDGILGEVVPLMATAVRASRRPSNGSNAWTSPANFVSWIPLKMRPFPCRRGRLSSSGRRHLVQKRAAKPIAHAVTGAESVSYLFLLRFWFTFSRFASDLLSPHSYPLLCTKTCESLFVQIFAHFAHIWSYRCSVDMWHHFRVNFHFQETTDSFFHYHHFFVLPGAFITPANRCCSMPFLHPFTANELLSDLWYLRLIFPPSPYHPLIILYAVRCVKTCVVTLTHRCWLSNKKAYRTGTSDPPLGLI